MTKQEAIKNELEQLTGILLLPKAVNNSEQRMALAQAYVSKGFRDYLENMIRNGAAVMIGIDKDNLELHQGRLLVLKELLAFCKQCYTEFEKINK